MRYNYVQIIIILSLFIFPYRIYSQSTFQVRIGGDLDESNSAVVQIPDGYMVMTRTSSFGAGNYDLMYYKLDNNGEIVWSKVNGHTGRDLPRDIIVNNDSYIFLACYTFNSPSYDNWYIFKTDLTGNIISSKYLGGDYDDELQGFGYFDNNNYILCGNTGTYNIANDFDLSIILMDSDLNFSWKKVFGTNIRETARGATVNSDNEIIVTGFFENQYNVYTKNMLIFKTDENGSLQWAKRVSGNAEEDVFSIVCLPDNTYIVAGYTFSFGAGGFDIFLTKFDNSGNLIWAKTYGGQNDEKAFNISKSSNNTFFISGITNSFGVGGNDVILLKIDGNGNFLSGYTFGESDYEGRTFSNSTNDNGVIIAASTESFNAQSKDAFIIKTDSTGKSCCGIPLDNIQITNVSPQVTDVTFTTGSYFPQNYHTTETTDIEPDIAFLCIDSLTISGEDTVCAFQQNVKYTISPNIFYSLSWTIPNGASISTNQNDTTIYINFGNTSGYIYIQANGCDNSVLDSIYVSVIELDPPDLGNDTTICSNEPVVLNPDGNYYSYLWQDGSTDSVFFVIGPGLYWVQVTNEYGCTASDSVYIDLLPSPQIDLGDDTLICSGTSWTLNAGSGFESYLWNTGSSDSSITINSTGTYWVEVTNEFGCSAIDSITIGLYPNTAEDLDLGDDTTFCYGTQFILNAGYGYTFYEWQDGSNDSIFIADTAGIYYVHVLNPCGEGWDTIQLSLYPVTEISLGSDTSVCLSDGFVLLDPGMGFQSYLWQDGSQNQTYYTNQSGDYWVEVIDSYGCPIYDSISLEFIDPDPELGADTAICNGEEITFSASEGFVSYLWNDGSNGTSISTGMDGIYWCEVTDTLGCVGMDSVLLSVIYPPDISLGNDTSICTGDSLLLYISPYDSNYVYYWFDGSSDSVNSINEEGYYWVQASNSCGSDFDSVSVSLLPLPYVFIGNDTIIGIKDEITLDAGNGFVSYLWNTGSEYQSITVSDSGNYWVRVSDGTCFNSDTINIEIVNCDLFVPIVFTPNWDSYNDYFYAIASDDITDFDLAVYNRWGEQMWETNEITGKWDGKKNSKDCATGTYFWVVEYKCLLSNKTFTLRGSVTLLR